jgi:hypothetical protein
MAWLRLSAGAPPGPRSRDSQELASTPKPDDFLRRLFAELCGIQRLPLHVTEERVIPRDEREARGFRGTPEIGYRLVERECLETSAVPYHVSIETYGLPGMEIRWHYCFDYAGQAGHAAFDHISLTARFEGWDARDQFTRIWRSVFGTEPVWQPAETE